MVDFDVEQNIKWGWSFKQILLKETVLKMKEGKKGPQIIKSFSWFRYECISFPLSQTKRNLREMVDMIDIIAERCNHYLLNMIVETLAETETILQFHIHKYVYTRYTGDDTSGSNIQGRSFNFIFIEAIIV